MPLAELPADAADELASRVTRHVTMRDSGFQFGRAFYAGLAKPAAAAIEFRYYAHNLATPLWQFRITRVRGVRTIVTYIGPKRLARAYGPRTARFGQVRAAAAAADLIALSHEVS